MISGIRLYIKFIHDSKCQVHTLYVQYRGTCKFVKGLNLNKPVNLL